MKSRAQGPPTNLRAACLLLIFIVTLLLPRAQTAVAQSAAAQTVPEAAYWSIIEEIELATADTEADAQQLHALADRLAQIDAVELPAGDVMPVDHSYLLAQLRADPPDATRIHTVAATLLDARAAQTAPVFTQADAAALAPILDQPTFRYDTEKRPPPAFVQRLLDAWARLLERLAGLFPGGIITVPAGAVQWITVAAVIALAAAIAVTMARIAGEFTGDARLADDEDGDGVPLTADAALRRAQTHSTAGDYRTAVRYLYLSTLLLLEEHGVLRYDRALTNREYLRRVAHDPTLSATLQNVVDVFDRVWYGFEPLDEVTYRRYADAVETLKRYQ